MARVTRSPQAEADILEICDYIAEGSMAEADRWVDRLDEEMMSSMPSTRPTMILSSTSKTMPKV
jgi:toxin ParE1/3/4